MLTNHKINTFPHLKKNKNKIAHLMNEETKEEIFHGIIANSR